MVNRIQSGSETSLLFSFSTIDMGSWVDESITSWSRWGRDGYGLYYYKSMKAFYITWWPCRCVHVFSLRDPNFSMPAVFRHHFWMHWLDSLEVRDETKHLIQSHAFRSHIPVFQSTRCSSEHSLSPSPLRINSPNATTLQQSFKGWLTTTKKSVCAIENVFLHQRVNAPHQGWICNIMKTNFSSRFAQINSTISVSLLFLKRCERASIEVHSAWLHLIALYLVPYSEFSILVTYISSSRQ